MDRARRAQPSANPIITRQWNMHCMKMHKKKLRKVKASIDNRPPKQMKHLRRNLKREQMREERYSAIERENRILLQKMAQILRTNKTMDTINQYRARSLNRESRRRELIRITHENQGILRRIQASEPTYNHITWEEERRAMERRIDNISAYDRTGREKVMKHIKSRARMSRVRNANRSGAGGRFRPQSAPTYQRVRRNSRGGRARPASALHSRREYDSGMDGSTASRDSYTGAGADASASGVPASRGVYRPASARRARGAPVGRRRPVSAARRRPGVRGGYSGLGSALDDPDLVAGAVLGGDDEVEAVVMGGDLDEEDEHKY